MRIGIDVGYGYSKAVADSGRRVIIPSTVVPAPLARGLSSAFGGKARDGHHLTLVINGDGEQRYTIGSVTGQRSWASSAAERSGYVPLVLAAAALVGAEGEAEIEVGLPLALWLQKDQRKALRGALREISAEVALDGHRARHIVIKEVHVRPQGAGAFAGAATADPGLAQKPTGLIDIGYRTTDYLAMRRVAGTVAPDEAACGSIDLGAGRVFEAVRLTLSDESGVMVPEGAVEDALANYRGQIHLRGKEYDAAELVNLEANALAQAIEEQLRRLWTDRLDLMGTVLVAGGGGDMVYRHLRDLHPATRLLRDAIFANAAGYLVMAG